MPRRAALDQRSCSPCWHRPVSARCMISAPDSVSCSWATSTSSGPMPACSNAAARRLGRRRRRGLDRDRRAEDLEGAEAARPEGDRAQVDRRARERLRALAARQHERHRALARRAEHVLRQRVVDHLGGEHLLLRERLAAPRVRIARAVVERLGRDLGERRLADAVLGHVALDLHREELRGEHEAGLAVPGAEAPVLGQRVERAGRVLVEADHERDVRRAGRRASRARSRARTRRSRSRCGR